MKFEKMCDDIIEEMDRVTIDLRKVREGIMDGSADLKESIEVDNNCGKTISAQKTKLEVAKLLTDTVRLCVSVKTFMKNNPDADIDDEMKRIAGIE